MGKDLSEGWNLNFAVGCTHACPFCYVDAIHKRFGASRYGDLVERKWGDYFLVPENLESAIRKTVWRRWTGKEVMMSSTHDPYLPVLAPWARRILEVALPAGVRVCLQTRSFLVTKDFDLLARYSSQVRLQISLATLDRDLARRIEPRVPSPEARMEVLRRAKACGLHTGVIIAPIFPAVSVRRDAISDLIQLISRLSEIHPDHVYGESLHVRGENMNLIREALGESVKMAPSFDEEIAEVFYRELRAQGIPATWWPK